MFPEGPEKDKMSDFIITIIVEVKNGNTFALLLEAIMVLETNTALNNHQIKQSILNNLTVEE